MSSSEQLSAELQFADLPFADLLTLSTMSLATASAQGEPHVAAVYFAAGEGLRLYFFSDPDSQHAQDAARDPRSAVSIYPESDDWREIRGLQMRGVVSALVSGQHWERAWSYYQEKFPFVKALKAVVARNQFYVFSPRWIRLVDNRRGFGFKQEWTIS